jgi:hypothetical protein
MLARLLRGDNYWCFHGLMVGAFTSARHLLLFDLILFDLIDGWVVKGQSIERHAQRALLDRSLRMPLDNL